MLLTRNFVMDDKPVATLYEFVEHRDTGDVAFRLLEGKYSGVVWSYRNVSVPKIDDPDTVEEIPLSFNYEIMYKPKDLEVVNEEFGPIIAPILVETIDKKLTERNIEYLHNENRNNDTEQSDL